jgi:hypothetical protein
MLVYFFVNRRTQEDINILANDYEQAMRRISIEVLRPLEWQLIRTVKWL